MKQRGFTFLEMIIVIVIVAVIAGIVGSVIQQQVKTQSQISTIDQIENEARLAFEQIMRDIRLSRSTDDISIVSFSTELRITTINGDYIIYDFDLFGKKFTREDNSAGAKNLLVNVTSGYFSYIEADGSVTYSRANATAIRLNLTVTVDRHSLNLTSLVALRNAL